MAHILPRVDIHSAGQEILTIYGGTSSKMRMIQSENSIRYFRNLRGISIIIDRDPVANPHTFGPGSWSVWRDGMVVVHYSKTIE
jgi:hypothetical protein